MITPKQLYAATDDGLQILELHIPNARDAAKNRKPVKLRSENTASAYIKHHTSKKGDISYYGVTDFGESSRLKDPIALHMDLTGLRFYEAVIDLAERFGVRDELSRSINKPDIRQELAPSDMPDGYEFWELLDDFTDDMCRVMGPKVTREHLRSLHWLPVKFFASVRDRKITYRYSNERFPIFMRECLFTNAKGEEDRFYKIYEPMNPDKGYRFRYAPRGKKQPDYVNGLEELRQAYRRFNDENERAWSGDPANEGKPYVETKLPEAIICSGERDSLCAKSQGYIPLWLNSETADLSPSVYNEIRRYVDVLYNVPDIDTTGIRRGKDLALKYIDIHTIWLPADYLSQYKDNRGKTRKDLRDWMELRPEPNEFKKLVKRARPACFWTMKYETSRDGKSSRRKYSIDFICLKNFLNLNGFYTLEDEKKEEPRLIKITGCSVEFVTARKIRAFVERWAEDEALDLELLNVIANTPFLSAACLESLRAVTLDFKNHSSTSQWLFFPKYALEITAAGLVKHDTRKADFGRYVWNHNIIQHEPLLNDDIFTITHPEGKTQSEDFDIKINDTTSSYFRYLINSSRIYWRRELEEYVDTLSPDEAAAYRMAHKFDIEGPALTAEEIGEQKRCLISKIFMIGYMLHRHKSESRSWAAYVMDNVIGDRGECNGGSCKSFLFFALKRFIRMITLDGRNKNLFDNKHWNENINSSTDIVLIDDLDEDFSLKNIYGVITGDLTVNPKGTSSFPLEYGDAPKFALSSNYVPKDFDMSTVRRTIVSVTSDYYHTQDEHHNHSRYRETRTIGSDFGKDLFNAEYTEAEWGADINFIIQCLRFYLSVAPYDIKIEPNIENIIFRKHLTNMTDNFREWAEQYFAEDGDHVNKDIVRYEAFDDYRKFSGDNKTRMHGFTRALRSFCFVTAHISEYNPKELCNSGDDRILKRVPNPATGIKVQTDMIHIRTVKEAERLATLALPKSEQAEMSF